MHFMTACSSSQRSELHLKVAKAIERRGASRINEVAETLAYHYSLSTQHDKAFRYCSLSGRKCLDIYSLEELERYFRKALSLLSRAPQCADNQAMATVVASLLEVLYLRGDLLGLREIAEQSHSAASDLWRYATTRLCALFPLHAVGASLRIRCRGGSRKIGARDRSTSQRYSRAGLRAIGISVLLNDSWPSRFRSGGESRAAECSMSVFDPATIIFSTGPIGRSPGIMSAAG